MFFEGSEKKVEVVVAESAPSLRSLGKAFWEDMVAKCNATILSSISNEKCDAYLLSESSLFVWEHHFVMLTCGTTTLVESVKTFMDKFEKEQILSVIFQRKNEYQSHLQKSSFSQDIDSLQQRMSGVAYQLGNLDTHHNYIYHLDKPYTPEDNDYTYELLMYHIQGPVAHYLRSENQNSATIRQLMNFEEILPGFEINDFVFEPFGYSMNAIKEGFYATMHITPQEDSSYVSFETNLDLANQHTGILDKLIATLQPGNFDIISFNGIPSVTTQEHLLMNQVEEPLSCGYIMRFSEYLQQQTSPVRAYKLK